MQCCKMPHSFWVWLSDYLIKFELNICKTYWTIANFELHNLNLAKVNIFLTNRSQKTYTLHLTWKYSFVWFAKMIKKKVKVTRIFQTVWPIEIQFKLEFQYTGNYHFIYVYFYLLNFIRHNFPISEKRVSKSHTSFN